MDFDRFCGTCKTSQESCDIRFAHARGQSLLGALQDLLILEKERGRHEWNQPLFGNELQQTIACPEAAAKSGHDHGAVQDDARWLHHVTSYTMSHRIGNATAVNPRVGH